MNKQKKIPIPEFEKFSKKEWWFSTKKADKIAKSIGYPVIVRSDGSEDKLGASAAGLYHTEKANNSAELTRVLRKVRASYDIEKVNKYLTSRNIPANNEQIDVLIQKYVESDISAIITSHPNQEDTYLIDLTRNKRHIEYKMSGGIIGDLNNSSKHMIPLNFWLLESTKKVMSELQRAIEDIKQVESLKKIKGDKISYQYEIGLLPYAFRQARPFRIKEYADFSIKDLNIKKSDGEIVDILIVFGITGSQGIELAHKVCMGPSFIHLAYLSDKKKIEVITKIVDKIYTDAKEFSDSLSILAVSFPELKLYSNTLEYRQELPKLSIFQIGDTNANPQYAWQDHKGFRVLERNTMVRFSSKSPFKHKDFSVIQYWSDGNRGKILFKEY